MPLNTFKQLLIAFCLYPIWNGIISASLAFVTNKVSHSLVYVTFYPMNTLLGVCLCVLRRCNAEPTDKPWYRSHPCPTPDKRKGVSPFSHLAGEASKLLAQHWVRRLATGSYSIQTKESEEK